MAKGKQKKPPQQSSRPGKLGFDGVDDDGAAQSKFKGLSSGARASLRKKMEERTSGEVEPIFTPPSVPTNFVDCLFFASELFAQRESVLEAARALSSTPSNVLDAFTLLGGPRCDAAIPAYYTLGELDARAGDLRYRAWEQHQPRHATFGLEASGVALVGASEARGADGSEADGPTEEEGPLATLLEMWSSPLCVAAGPVSVSFTGLPEDHPSRLHQLRGSARLLREAFARQLPVIVSCDAAAEADFARLILAALAKAPTPAHPLPAPICAAPARHSAPAGCRRTATGRRGECRGSSPRRGLRPPPAASRGASSASRGSARHRPWEAPPATRVGPCRLAGIAAA